MGNFQTRQILPPRQQSVIIQSQLSNNKSSIFLNSNINTLDDYFMLDKVHDIHMEVKYPDMSFIWLQPRVEQNQHLQHRMQFNYNLPLFAYYKQFDQLKQRLQKQNGNTIFRVIVSAALEKQAYKFINRNRLVDKMHVFAQNPTRIQQIMTKYDKAKYYGYTLRQIMQTLPVPSTYQNNVFFFVEQDVPLIKKYCLNYYGFLHHRDMVQSRQDFVQLAFRFYPNKKEEIYHFNQSYMKVSEEDKVNLVLAQVFQNSFYWDLIYKLPKVTSNPKGLGYLRFAFKDLFNIIRKNYKPSEVRNTQPIYIVAELTDEEIIYLNDNIDGFMTFTSFVKGFVTKKYAIEYTKKLKAQNKRFYIFEVVLPKKQALREQLDFGYMIMDKKFKETESEPSVLFNIFNVFKITRIQNRENKNYVYLEYGALATIYKAQEPLNNRRQLSRGENELLGFLDMFQSSTSKIKNQVSVYKQSRCFIESIISCQNVLSDLIRSKSPQQQIQLVLLQKGDSLRLNDNLDDAITTYLSIQNEQLRTLAMIRSVGIQLSRGNIQSAQHYFEYVLPRQKMLLQTWGLYEQHYLARHYHCVLKMKRGQFQQAYQGFKKLKDEIFNAYDHKINTVQFMDQLVKCMDACCKEMNNRAGRM